MDKSKQPEITLTLRFAEAEHLLNALSLVTVEQRTSVTHQGLQRQLTIIRDHWLKMERDRKAQKSAILRRKAKKA